MYGLALLRPGRRRTAPATHLLCTIFAARILPFHREAGPDYGAVERQTGRSPSPLDLQIAAIALARGMTIATRNTRDFAALGPTLVDPWQPHLTP